MVRSFRRRPMSRDPLPAMLDELNGVLVEEEMACREAMPEQLRLYGERLRASIRRAEETLASSTLHVANSEAMRARLLDVRTRLTRILDRRDPVPATTGPDLPASPPSAKAVSAS